MSRFNIPEHPRTQLHYWISPIFFPHLIITLSPGAAVAVAARLLWVGLNCQSIRGRFSRLFSRASYPPNIGLMLSVCLLPINIGSLTVYPWLWYVFWISMMPGVLWYIHYLYYLYAEKFLLDESYEVEYTSLSTTGS